MQLAQQWSALQRHGLPPEAVDNFRCGLRYEICRKYPWLSAELFALEGQLGGGPGFREYDGEFFPPPLPEAPGQMTKFLQLLSMIQPNDILPDLIRKAEQGIGNSSQLRMLTTTLRARIKTREHVVRMMYGKIANQHSPYTLGGARIFLALWTRQQKYALAMTGIIWLLHHPVTPIMARAETVRRKLLLQHAASSSSTLHGSPIIPLMMPPVSGGVLPALLHEVH